MPENEEDCRQSECQNVAYIQFDLGYGKRWFCFDHAVEMFEAWDGPLEIVEFPDESLFECDGYPDKLSMLETVWKHGDS
jgi:hypothetical protein